jgi:hypothetical protein
VSAKFFVGNSSEQTLERPRRGWKSIIKSLKPKRERERGEKVGG